MAALARTLLTAALVAGVAPPAAAQTPRDDHDEMERPEVREVRLVGVRAVGRGELAEALATKASSCLGLVLRPFCAVTKSPLVYERRYLDRTEFARDVVRLLVFYYKRGWRDATVDTAVARVGPNQVRVTFTVTERAPTTVASIAVDDSARTPAGGRRGRGRGRGRLTPRPGEPLDLLRLDSTVARLREGYWNRGYGDAVVERPAIAVDDSADTAGVRIAVRRGPLTPIARIDIMHVGPQRRVSDETIRRSLTIAPGDLFRRGEVARSQRALYESGFFRSALIDTAVATEAGSGRTVCASQASGTPRPVNAAAAAVPDSAKALVVCVVEGELREVRTSVGFTSADFAQAEARFTHNYFLGGARRLDVSGVVGNLGARQLRSSWLFANNGFDVIPGEEAGRYFAPTYQAGIDVRQRWFGSPRNTLGAGVFTHRRSSPGVFVDRGLGASATFTRELAERLPASATYRFEVSRVEASDIYFCVNYGVCDRTTVSALQGQQRLSPLAITATSNRTDDAFSPTRGWLGRFTAEHASAATISDFRYNRLSIDGSIYRRIPFRRSVLAARARVGWVDALAGTNAAVGARAAADGGGEVLHPRKRFYAGGSQSVRGFGENQLGPRVLTIAPDEIRGVRDSSGVTLTACPAPTSLRDCFLRRRTDIADGSFIPRPLGGTTLLEGNVELRVPIWGAVVGALFVDGAMLGERSLGDLGNGTGAITPGFGVRYRSPVGPIRVDLGVNPRLVERLPVVTQTTDSLGNRVLLELSTGPCDTRGGRDARDGCRSFPTGQAATGIRGIVNRITLHLSIGEAF